MSVTPWAAARIWDPTEAMSVHGASSAAQLSNDPKLLGVFANNTARDNAKAALLASPGMSGAVGFRAFVAAPPSGDSPGPDWCGWDGTQWVWDHPTPIFHQPAPIGSSHGFGGGFTNTTLTDWTPAHTTITITRRGLCWIGFDYDVETGAAGGWGTASTQVRVDGATITDGSRVIATEQAGGSSAGGSRRFDVYQARVPVYLTAGAHELRVDVAKGTATGSWRFAAFAWKVAQY